MWHWSGAWPSRNTKIRKRIPQKLEDGARSPNFDIEGQILNFGPDFLETGKLWATYFGTFRKPLISTTSHPKYVGQISTIKKVIKGQILRIIPIFSKLVN